MLTESIELIVKPEEINDNFFKCIEIGDDLDDGILVLPETAVEELGMEGVPEFLVLLSDIDDKYPKRVSKETPQFVLIRKDDVERFKLKFKK